MIEYQQRINKKYPDEDLLIISCSTTKNLVKIKCNSCGKIYSFARLSSVFKKSKKYVCQECGRRKKIRIRFEQSLKDKFRNEHIEILEFTTTQHPITYKCLKCGHQYQYKIADSVKKKKHLCDICYKEEDPYSIEIKERFRTFIKKSSKWELVQNDFSTTDNVECKCLECGKINSKSIYDYMKNIGCTCGRWNTKEKLLNAFGSEYKLLSDCTTNDTRVSVQHSCGYVYTLVPHRFLAGYARCPRCSKKHSAGENSIKHWLTENNIDFVMEKPVKIKNHLLRFDFYLPYYDIFIEFQGKQHFEQVDCWGGKQGFLQRQKYDNLKREFCGNKLYEISYKDINNIPIILKSIVQRLDENRTL